MMTANELKVGDEVMRGETRLTVLGVHGDEVWLLMPNGATKATEAIYLTPLPAPTPKRGKVWVYWSASSGTLFYHEQPNLPGNFALIDVIDLDRIKQRGDTNLALDLLRLERAGGCAFKSRCVDRGWYYEIGDRRSRYAPTLTSAVAAAIAELDEKGGV